MGSMSEEMKSLNKNFVRELVPKPKNRIVIGSKWVYQNKEDISEKTATAYMARLATKEFSQKEGVNYDEIVFPVVKHTSIRMLLSLVAQLNMESKQFDAKTTFLLRDLKKIIYMSQPEGF